MHKINIGIELAQYVCSIIAYGNLVIGGYPVAVPYIFGGGQRRLEI